MLTAAPIIPITATILDNLALTYCDLGQPDKTLPLQQRAQQVKR